jgi:hypothetical protein
VARADAWLRSNAEHYLLVAAQERVGRKYAYEVPAPPRRAKDRIFLSVFVPIYRRLPWNLRQAVLRRMPGSHRRTWEQRERRPHGPAV